MNHPDAARRSFSAQGRPRGRRGRAMGRRLSPSFQAVSFVCPPSLRSSFPTFVPGAPIRIAEDLHRQVERIASENTTELPVRSAAANFATATARFPSSAAKTALCDSPSSLLPPQYPARIFNDPIRQACLVAS